MRRSEGKNRFFGNLWATFTDTGQQNPVGKFGQPLDNLIVRTASANVRWVESCPSTLPSPSGLAKLRLSALNFVNLNSPAQWGKYIFTTAFLGTRAKSWRSMCFNRF